MTPKDPAQKMRDYLDGDGTPHPDRETLEALSLAVELLDALVACWYAEDIDGHAMIAEAAARRVFGWVACTHCDLLFPDLSGGLCNECADAAADDLDDDTDDDTDDLDENPFGGALDR